MSLEGKRRVSSEQGRVGDQESVVALNWSRARPGERIVTQERGIQLRRAFARTAQYDAGLGGLSGRAESRRGSDSAVQEGVTKRIARGETERVERASCITAAPFPES